MDKMEFNQENRRILLKFLDDTEERNDLLSSSVITTMAQFILNLKINIVERVDPNGFITPFDLIQSQIEELQRCIIDLASYKPLVEKGVSIQ